MSIESKFNRLMIFDGAHCLHRNLAVPNNWNMTTSKGFRTGGIFGVLRTILKEASVYNYYPVVVFDKGLSKRRLDIYPNYKHTEEKKEKQLLLESREYRTEEELLDEEFRKVYIQQRDILIQLLPYFKIPVVCFDDWEGDDLIYILTKLAKDSIVVSDDKDLIQLIRDDETGRCRIRRAMRDEFWDLDKLKTEYTDIEEYILNKSIVGDGSDNIPSACYGVGEKTASDLYKFYKYIKENELEYPKTEEELTEICKKYNLPKRKAFLNFNEEQLFINYQLINLKFVEKDIDNQEENMINYITSNVDYFFKNEFDKKLLEENVLTFLNYLEIKTFDYNNLFKLVEDVKSVVNSDTELSENRKISNSSLF